MRLLIVDGDEERSDEVDEGGLYRLLEGQETWKLLASWPNVAALSVCCVRLDVLKKGRSPAQHPCAASRCESAFQDRRWSGQMQCPVVGEYAAMASETVR